VLQNKPYQDNLSKDIVIEQQDIELRENKEQLEQNKKALINSAIMMKQA
jgi:hypothetical protein